MAQQTQKTDLTGRQVQVRVRVKMARHWTSIMIDGGPSAGCNYWWLKDETTGEFIPIPRKLSNKPLTFSVVLDVEHDYTIGAGREFERKRLPLTVYSDGSMWFWPDCMDVEIIRVI